MRAIQTDNSAGHCLSDQIDLMTPDSLNSSGNSLFCGQFCRQAFPSYAQGPLARSSLSLTPTYEESPNSSSKPQRSRIEKRSLPKFFGREDRPQPGRGGGGEMKRQMVKGLTMVMMVATIALVTAVVSAKAQGTLGVKANVPFEFVVGDKTVPAGAITIRSTENSAALSIKNLDASISTYRLTTPMRAKSDNAPARLVFHRYGQNYFLREIWDGGSTGRELRESKQERAIKRENAAVAQSRYEIVEVVATLQ
jgi:hypothetical protein